MIQNEEIFIRIKGAGFTFLIDKRLEHNLISPALLSFFYFEKGQTHLPSENDIRAKNSKPTYDNSQPFMPEYMNNIGSDGVFHYVGKNVGRCTDNKLRVCRAFMLEFECEGCTFSFPFLLDKSLDKAAILGGESWSHIIKTVMTRKNTFGIL